MGILATVLDRIKLTRERAQKRALGNRHTRRANVAQKRGKGGWGWRRKKERAGNAISREWERHYRPKWWR